MTTQRKLHIKIVQTPLEWEYPEANRSQIEGILSNINSATDLVCLPEMFTTGFSMNVHSCAETMDGPTVEWMNKMTLERGFALCATIMIEELGNYYNRFILSENGEITCIYDKRHLFRMADEHKSFTAGAEPLIAQFKGWKFMPRVCYDLRFPVWNRNSASQLQIYLANWPDARGAAWDKLLMARAIENQCYVVGVNRTGTDGSGKNYNGHSIVIDPYGMPVTQVAYSENGLIEAILDLGVVEGFREKFPVWRDADQFEINL
jgi:predicted amidohydrolase